MPDPRRTALAHDEGATLLFQRSLLPPGERCFACPHRHVPADMSADPLTAPALPLPPLHGPRAAPLPGQARAAPLPGQARAAPGLPRPALLPALDPHATLVLPDALKTGGPEAATVQRPVAATAPAVTGREGPPRDQPARPAFDELASPDITMMQQVSQVSPAVRRPPRRTRDARAYFVLNLWLGLLIVTGLVVLIGREAPVAEDHARQ